MQIFLCKKGHHNKYISVRMIFRIFYVTTYHSDEWDQIPTQWTCSFSKDKVFFQSASYYFQWHLIAIREREREKEKSRQTRPIEFRNRKRRSIIVTQLHKLQIHRRKRSMTDRSQQLKSRRGEEKGEAGSEMIKQTGANRRQLIVTDWVTIVCRKDTSKFPFHNMKHLPLYA